MTCEENRRCIHEALDGDLVAVLPAGVTAHAASCGACREFLDDLQSISGALRALPRAPLPPEALDVVWRETIRASRDARGPARHWGRAAAAVFFVTALSATTLYVMLAPARPAGPSAVELARASAQADMVFGYTARALAATREAAAGRVLASRVSPAVRGVAAPRSPRRP
jgi:predicted anti-sigma-YlaC factor YlaD